MTDRYRLVTRSDFDGLVCAVLFRDMDMIDDILFVHPKDMQDGLIEITDRDITTNLPYVEGVHLAFDHHFSETLRNEVIADNHIIDAGAKSAARVVWDHYGGAERFPERWLGMMEAVDQADSADYSLEDIMHPEGWTLLNFLMDPRTGLGRFREFRISNYQLMMELIEYCKDHDIDEILQLADVRDRVELYFEQQPLFKEQLKRLARVHDNVVVLDLRDVETIHAGNRFMIYAMFPDTNVSIHVIWGKGKQNTVFAVGKSILNRSSETNIGRLLLQYHGGGHANAGTCQVDHQHADAVEGELIAALASD
ncbi:MAG: exopolyphosphatase [Acidimicrobiia bacterium]|nr:exopolyphosphatase [Acidimicrobiia bacterium]NNC74496.1 exopolyphosphatase [Acidimicrobiia bacterium]